MRERERGEDRQEGQEGRGRKGKGRDENWRKAKPPQATHLDRNNLFTKPTIIKCLLCASHYARS